MQAGSLLRLRLKSHAATLIAVVYIALIVGIARSYFYRRAMFRKIFMGISVCAD
jgi:hypothetical protein